MKTFFFPITVHLHDDAGPLIRTAVVATSPNEALQKAVHANGSKSAYEIRISANHPWVIQRQAALWKKGEDYPND